MPKKLRVHTSAEMSAQGIYDPQGKIQSFARSDHPAK
jgi:hypothetical protein